MIEEIKDAELITSYTRWVDAVQVRGTENPEVYLIFSPRFERIWLKSKKRLLDHVAREAQAILVSAASMLSGCTVGRKSMSPSVRSAFHWRSFAKCLDWSR